MKKIFKILLIIFIAFVVLLCGGLLTLKIMFPMSKIKAQLQEQVKANFNREIDFKDFSLSFTSLSLKDFALSEKTTFKDGTFFSAKKAYAKIDLKALLHKQIKIETIGLENLTINIIKYKDGKFNFDDLVNNSQTTQEEVKTPVKEDSSVIDISAKQIYTKDALINFNDEEAQLKFSINNLNIEINDFDMKQDFSVIISCLTKLNMPSLVLDPVLFTLNSKVNLADMDMPKAKAEIESFKVIYEKTELSLNGLIADFSNPQINLAGTLSGIDNKLVQKFTSGPITAFALPVANIVLSAKVNVEKNTTDISQAKISIANSYIKTRASLDYSKPEFAFTSNTNMALSLDELSSIAKEALSAFALKGAIEGSMVANQNPALNLSGNIELKNLGARIMSQALEKTNGTIIIKSLQDIATKNLSGNFGGSPWDMALTYKKQKNTDIDLKFNMKKLTLEDINFETLLSSGKQEDKPETVSEQENLNSENQKQEKSAENKTEKADTSVNSSGGMGDLYNLKAAINIEEIANNVLTAKTFTVNTSIKDFDTSLAKAQGTLSLNTKDIEIRDIDKLMASSKLLKVLFGSVKVVQKAFNFAKLDNSSLTNGIIKCSVIDAEYGLDKGIVSIIKTDIDSDLSVVKATGKADLLNDSVDMKIQAQLGKTGSNGFKPVVINVKGPLNNPSYKVDLLSSISSIVGTGNQSGQNSAANLANSAKDVVKSLGNLFKK